MSAGGRWVSSGDLLYSIVTIANVAYSKVAKRVNLKHFYHPSTHCDECINYFYQSNHFIIYTYISYMYYIYIITLHTLSLHDHTAYLKLTSSYVNYIAVKLETKEMSGKEMWYKTFKVHSWIISGIIGIKAQFTCL